MTKEKNINSFFDKFQKAGPGTGKDVKYVIVDLANLFLTLVIYLVASVLIGFVAFKVLAVGGIEAIMAQLMAVTCVNNPGIPCDYNTLIGGIGLSLIILTGVAIAIVRETIKIEKVPFRDAEDITGRLTYTKEMNNTLRTIQKLGGAENLKGLADWKGIPYTTIRRYVEQFEKDGYITIHSSGKGAPLEIRLVQ